MTTLNVISKRKSKTHAKITEENRHVCYYAFLLYVFEKIPSQFTAYRDIQIKPKIEMVIQMPSIDLRGLIGRVSNLEILSGLKSSPGQTKKLNLSNSSWKCSKKGELAYILSEM